MNCPCCTKETDMRSPGIDFRACDGDGWSFPWLCLKCFDKITSAVDAVIEGLQKEGEKQSV